MNSLHTILISVITIFLSANSNFGKVNSPLSIPDSLMTSSTVEETLIFRFEDSVSNLYDVLDDESPELSFEAFRHAMIGHSILKQQDKLDQKNLLTIIDFTKPSTEKRLYIIDLEKRRIVYKTYVSHGRNTGENKAVSFSNVVHSNQSSLGFYRTAETYIGSKGYSLKLDGLDKGFNDKMRQRAVVIHGADYVSESWIQKYGRLGRSQGCPALPAELSREIIDTIKNGSLIFAYFNDKNYLKSSVYLDLHTYIQNFATLAHQGVK